MKILFAGICLVFAAACECQASIIADWTFETSQPTNAGPYSPEYGSGNASYSGSGTVSSSAGNDGSANSFSIKNWDVGDYYQFKVSTVGYVGISIQWDQYGSKTGPASFILEYGFTDTGTFTQIGSQYTIDVSSSWVTNSPDLSSIDSLIANAGSVYFRLVDNSTNSIDGGVVAGTGTDRVDNFTVSGDALAAIPEASTLYAGVSAFLLLLGSIRRKIISRLRAESAR
ncbi:MAG: hypothetical protein ACREFE_00155 [Limisphaerales bacterium]